MVNILARTYWSEGRNFAHLVRGILIFSSLAFYFYVIPDVHFSVPIILVFASIVIGEFAGNAYTQAKRRNAKKQKSIRKSNHTNSPSKRLSEQKLLTANIDTLSGTDFERLMAMYYRDQGYDVTIVGGAGDHEVDLIMKGKEGYKIAVQCKRWKNNVGNDIVLRLKAGKQVHGCYDAWIVTTSYFTKAAQEAAERLNIRLINGLQVHDMINRWRRELKQKGM